MIGFALAKHWEVKDSFLQVARRHFAKIIGVEINVQAAMDRI